MGNIFNTKRKDKQMEKKSKFLLEKSKVLSQLLAKLTGEEFKKTLVELYSTVFKIKQYR